MEYNPSEAQDVPNLGNINLDSNVCGLLVEPTATLPKLSADGESVNMMPPVLLAVPLSGSLCGLPGALSEMVTVPDFVPGEVGVNVTLSMQEALGANLPFSQ